MSQIPRRFALLTLAVAALSLGMGVRSALGAGGDVVDEVHYTFTGTTSIAFDWRGSATELRYGLDASYGSTATGTAPTPLPWSSSGPFREAEITGLAPGTTYHYSIGGGPDHTFHTAPTGDLRFDVQADVGSSRDARTAITQADIAADDPSFALVPGDLSYADQYGTSAVDRHFNDVMAWSQTAAYMPTWGNHEWKSPPSADDDLRNYRGRFMLPHSQTSPGTTGIDACSAACDDWGWFDAGGIRFISYPEPYPGAWTDWTSKATTIFQQAQGDASIRYIVSFGHRPAYSTGSHSGDSTLAGILNGFGDKYSKYVLNLNGHSHDYERFQPIHGVTHVTTGGGGEDQETTTTPPAPRTVVRALHLEHLRVDVTSSGMSIQAICGAASKYEDTSCRHGTVLDSFTIAAPRPAPVVRVQAPADGMTVSTGTPPFSGTAGTATGDGSTVDVNVYAGSGTGGSPVQTRTATVQSDGTWSIAASPALADGTYTARATQVGTAGTGASAPRTFIVDTAHPDSAAPTSAASSPATSTGTVTVTFTASDLDGLGLSAVQLYVRAPGANGWALAGTVNSPGASGTFSYTPDAGSGAYGFYTTAVDKAGNRESPPPPASGTVPAPDSTTTVSLPSVAAPSITSPADGSFSNTGAVTLSGTAVPGTVVVLSDGSTVVTSTPAGGTGAWAGTVAGLSDGVHRFTARATSTSLVTSSASKTASVTVDTAPPGSSATADAFSTSTTIPVNYAAQDGLAGLASVELWVRPPGAGSFTLVKTDTSGAAAGSFDYSAAGGEGSYAFYTVAVDKAGNREDPPPTADATTTLDMTPPTVVVNAPPDGGAVGDTLPTFSGTAGTAAGDSPAVAVDVYAGPTPTGSPVQTLATTRDATTGAWSADASAALAPGTYTVVASQRDTAGNTGSSTPQTFTIDTAVPTVTAITPGDGTSTNDTTPTFSGTAGTAPGDSATVEVRVFSGSLAAGLPVETRTTTRDPSTGAFSVDAAPPLDPGTYTAQAAQSDAAGNVGTSAPRTFTVDTAVPVVRLDQPADGSTTSVTSPMLAGVGGTAPGDAATVTVTLYAGSTASGSAVRTRTASVDQDTGAWSVDAGAALADGAYTALATQDDAAGNTGSSGAHTFRIDTSAPAVTLVTPADGAETNDATPALSGVAGTAPGDSSTVSVEIHAGSSLAGALVQTRSTGRDAASGAWTVDAAPALAEGTYTAQASQRDAAGNTGTSAARTFAIDTTPPAVSLVDPPQASQTKDATPTFDGVAGTGPGELATVTVRVFAGPAAGGTPAQTLSATRDAATGAWSADAAPALPSGTYTAQASQADAAGNTGTSAAHTFTIDTNAPAITLSNPADGSRTNATAPRFDGTAGTAAGDVSAVTVDVFAGSSATGTPVRTLSTTRDQSTGAYSVAAGSALSPGTYTARASQDDAAGNTGASAAHTFVIDTTEPAVTLVHPSDGVDTADTTPTFEGDAGTGAGDLPTVTVRIYSGATAGGSPQQTRTATRDASTGAWSVDATALAQGTYTATASQDDAAGNTGTSAAHTFRVDTTAPAITVAHPADGSTTNDTTPTLDGTAGTDPGDAATVTVEIHAGTSTGGALEQTLTPTRDPATGAWSVDAGALGEGSHTVVAAQDDAAGNAGTSTAHSFTLDTTAPGVSLVHPADGSTTGDQTPTFDGAGGTASGDAGSVSVAIHAGTGLAGAVVQTRTTTRDPSTGAFSVDAAPALADGTYTAVATQDDAAGNTGRSAAHTFTVSTLAPVVTLDHPAGGDRTADTTPTFDGTASTAADPQVTVSVWSGGTVGAGAPDVTYTATRDAATGAWSVGATAPLADGTYTAQASQQDQAGHTGMSAAHTFTIDTVAPLVTLLAPAEGSATNDTTPTLSGTAGLAPGDDASVTVVISAAGAPAMTRTATPDGSGNWSVTPGTPLAEGDYSVRATQNDAAGNTGGTSSVSFTVDTTPPTVSLDQPANGLATKDSTPTFAGTAGRAARDGGTVTVRVYEGSTAAGAPLQTRSTAPTASGDWSVAADPTLPDGRYTVDAAQRDGASNEGTTAGHTFAVDTQAPSSTASATVSGAGIAVAYHAEDAGAAGLETVELYARDPGEGAFHLAGSTSSPDAAGAFAYTPHGDGPYGFYTMATDRAGNRETDPAGPDTTVTLQPTPVLTSPPPETGSGPPPPAQLTVALAPSRTQRIGRAVRKGIALSITCDARCSVTLVARVNARQLKPSGSALARTRVIGRVTADVTRPGAARQMRIRLKAWARRAIAKLSKLSVRVNVTVTPAGSGAAQHFVRTVKLKR